MIEIQTVHEEVVQIYRIKIITNENNVVNTKKCLAIVSPISLSWVKISTVSVPLTLGCYQIWVLKFVLS